MRDVVRTDEDAFAFADGFRCRNDGKQIKRSKKFLAGVRLFPANLTQQLRFSADVGDGGIRDKVLRRREELYHILCVLTEGTLHLQKAGVAHLLTKAQQGQLRGGGLLTQLS